MRKYELYPEYRDLFEYCGNNEIERVRIKGGQQRSDSAGLRDGMFDLVL